MPTEKNHNTQKKPLNNYAKYSALGFQMAAIIIGGVWLGVKADEWLAFHKFPLFKLTLSLGSVGVAMYFLIKNVSSK